MIIVEIAGRLGRDPETRFTPSGQKVTTLTVATNVRKSGKDETVWWRVTIWGDRFDKMMPYLKKGSAVIVIGEMSKPEIWTDKEGRPQVSLDLTAEIVRFSPFGNSDRAQESQGNQASHQQGSSNYGQEGYESGGGSGYGGGSNAYYGNGQASSVKTYAPASGDEEPLPF